MLAWDESAPLSIPRAHVILPDMLLFNSPHPALFFLTIVAWSSSTQASARWGLAGAALWLDFI